MMVFNNFLRIAAAVMLPVAVACTSETALNIENNLSDGSGGEGAVRFSLSVPSSPATRAVGDEVAASDDEKSVSSLYAVLFRDADASGSVADKGQEDDGDVFFKMIDVLDLKDGGAYSEDTGSSVDGVTTTDTYTLPVSTGSYQIVFVANSDGSLKASLDALKEGSSTVKDFKNTVCAQAPDSKYDSSSSETSPGLLMVSDFYGAVVKTEETTSLAKNEDGIVYLERVMARIDIVNKASGITITDVTFSNRAVKTALVSDSPAFTSDYVEASKTYTLNLTGDSSVSDDAETNKYKANIYSYEQYGTGDDAPSLSISYKYTIEGVTTTGTQEVKFEKSTSSEGGDGSAVTEQINLRRNHLYTVIVSNSAGRLRFTLTVADWNSGETFEVSTDELIDGTDPYGKAKVGNFMLSDGKFATAKAVAASTELQSKAIGLVVFRYSDTRPASQTIKDTLAKKGVDAPHGLVLALKNATSNGPVIWSSYTADKTAYTSLADAYSKANDGYTATAMLYSIDYFKNTKAFDSALAMYAPAFYAAYTYKNIQAPPENTTGWYLPSYGEWCDLLSSFDTSEYDESKDEPGYKKSSGTAVDSEGLQVTVAANINACLEKVGNGNYEAFSYDSDPTVTDKGTGNIAKCGYWSATEYKVDDSATIALQVYDIIFYTDKLSFSVARKNTNYRQVRCVLAF